MKLLGCDKVLEGQFIPAPKPKKHTKRKRMQAEFRTIKGWALVNRTVIDPYQDNAHYSGIEEALYDYRNTRKMKLVA